MLDQLSPEERAAFLLREVFEHDYGEIAETLDKTEPACRQIVHRAKQRLLTQWPSPRSASASERRLLERFLSALRDGDEATLLRCVSPHVQFLSDGGGKVAAARHGVIGASRVAHLLLTVQRKWGHADTRAIVSVNGEPAFVTARCGALHSVTSIVCDGERIAGFFRQVNPDKLRALQSCGRAGQPADATAMSGVRALRATVADTASAPLLCIGEP